MEKHTEKEQKIIQKFVFEKVWDGKQYDFSEEMLDCIYKELKSIGIVNDKKYLIKVFENLIKLYESDPNMKK